MDASHGDGLACIWVSDSGGKDAAVQLANGLGSNQSWKPGLDSVRYRFVTSITTACMQ